MRRVLPLVPLIIAAPLAAQNVPTVRYDRADARFPEPLSMIQGFRALDANRAIAADPLEGRVTLLDWRSGSVTEIGRQGGGPGEYGAPGPLFARGDTTLMLDMGNRRLLAIADGRISRNTIPLGGPDGIPIFPRAVDQQGRIYFDLAGIASPATAEYAQQGRAPLMRWDPGTDRTDTLGMVSFPPMAPAGPGEVRMTLGGGAYQPRDAWAVTPDGRVGIARTSPYRVEWVDRGRPVVGPEVAYGPVPVGDAEKNAWADRMANRGISVSVENGVRRTSRPPRPNIGRMAFPEVMPPFEGGVIATPSGELWVERARPASERARTYDVFNAQGQRVHQVVFPDGQRVLAVGDGFLMASRMDEDGLEWIERFGLRS